jgi:hypothetical protein
MRATVSPPSVDLREFALRYAAHGWSVIPIEPRGKRPLVSWLEFQQRPATRAEIEGWYRRWPDANVGVVTGSVSGLVVVDVDDRDGGAESLAALELDHGPLAATVEAATGGGGRHVYFAHPGGTVASRVGLAPGIDVRGDGGCVVAPPSLHPSGRRYTWLPGHGPGEVPLAAAPEWIRRGGGRSGHPLAHWRRLVREGVVEGERNATIASLAGHLLWHEVDPEVMLELLLAWNQARCAPPLADDEVARVVASIVRSHRREAGGT